MLTIKGKGLGRRRPLFEDYSIPPPGDIGEGGPFTLRDLITHVVRQEVSAFEKRQESRRLDRVLSPGEIADGADRGKISPEGRDPKRGATPRVDLGEAVAVALEGFVDGLYLVSIDDLECRDLDAIVHLGPDSRVTFIRLTFLAGA
ncbi:hypothetical protein P12x_001834 [Tundrisphaera lichenicola]|uniref:hypothetical protein n=1 Tax=Tundrisphaera lichenicola TaxID=2029860 RepID=UPI003EB9262F